MSHLSSSDWWPALSGLLSSCTVNTHKPHKKNKLLFFYLVRNVLLQNLIPHIPEGVSIIKVTFNIIHRRINDTVQQITKCRETTRNKSEFDVKCLNNKYNRLCQFLIF